MADFIDRQAIAETTAQLLGDSVRVSTPMILGHPLTKAVPVDVTEMESPGYVWVHGLSGVNTAISGNLEADNEDKQGAIMALLSKEVIPRDLVMFGAPVLVQQTASGMKVIGLDPIPAAEFFYGLRNHPQASIVLSQLDVGLIRPTQPASGKIYVTAFPLLADNTAFKVPTLLSGDLIAAYEPGLSSGEARAIQIGVNWLTNTVSLVAGDIFENTSHDNAFEAEYPRTVGAVYLAGWVKIYSGMVVISLDDILHAQQLYIKPPGLDEAAVDTRIESYFDRLVIDRCGNFLLDAEGDLVFGD